MMGQRLHVHPVCSVLDERESGSGIEFYDYQAIGFYRFYRYMSWLEMVAGFLSGTQGAVCLLNPLAVIVSLEAGHVTLGLLFQHGSRLKGLGPIHVVNTQVISFDHFLVISYSHSSSIRVSQDVVVFKLRGKGDSSEYLWEGRLQAASGIRPPAA